LEFESHRSRLRANLAYVLGAVVRVGSNCFGANSNLRTF
jgi:hypothetical protein